MASLRKQQVVSRRKRTREEQKDRRKKRQRTKREKDIAQTRFRKQIKEQLGFDKLRLKRRDDKEIYTKFLGELEEKKAWKWDNNARLYTIKL